MQNRYGTGTEPERNHVPVPGPLIQQVPAARNHSSDHAQPRISWYFYLHVADMAGNLPTSGHLTLGLVPFREFPVPSRSVYSALTTRPDPYRGLKSGPGTISSNCLPKDTVQGKRQQRRQRVRRIEGKMLKEGYGVIRTNLPRSWSWFIVVCVLWLCVDDDRKLQNSEFGIRSNSKNKEGWSGLRT